MEYHSWSLAAIAAGKIACHIVRPNCRPFIHNDVHVMEGKVSTKWRKHVFVLSCKCLTSKHKNMHICMYLLLPHYIIMVNGL